jgi:hypothetical protein
MKFRHIWSTTYLSALSCLFIIMPRRIFAMPWILIDNTLSAVKSMDQTHIRPCRWGRQLAQCLQGFGCLIMEGWLAGLMEVGHYLIPLSSNCSSSSTTCEASHLFYRYLQIVRIYNQIHLNLIVIDFNYLIPFR